MTYRALETDRARAFLVALSIVFCYLALPGNPLPVLTWICLVPFGLAIHGASLSRSAAYSFAIGFAGWLGSTGGLVTGLSLYSQVSIAEAIFYVSIFCAYLAIPYGLFGFLYGVFQWMKYPAGPLMTAACLTVLVSFAPTPVPVGLAHALYVFPRAIQILDLGGEPLLLFVVVLVNWLFVDLVLRIRAHRRLRFNLVSMLLVGAAVSAYGNFRLMQYHEEEANADPAQMMTIATMQPNIPIPDRSNAVIAEPPHSLDELLTMSSQALAEHRPVGLVVWPETPDAIQCADPEVILELTSIASQYETPFLINCVQKGEHGGEHNTALMISERGESTAYYKQKLFPFAEYLPGEKRFPILRKLIPKAAHYVPGEEKVLFSISESHVIFAAICYEVLFSSHVKSFVDKGGTVLANPTNDAWFGDSRIAEFLISSSIYHAIQYRLPVIRVSNSGNSLFVRASGELSADGRAPTFERKTSVAQVYVPTNRSPYSSLGNTFLYVMTTLWGIALWQSKNRRAVRE